MIQKLIIKTVIKLISKQFKLDKVLNYVEGENNLDKEMKSIKMELHEQNLRISKLESK